MSWDWLTSISTGPWKWVAGAALAAFAIIVALGSDPTGNDSIPDWMRFVSGWFVFIALFGSLIVMAVLLITGRISW